MQVTNSSTQAWPEGIATSRMGGLPPKAMGRQGVVKAKLLATGSTADGLNFGFSVLQYGGGEERFETIRHHHAFEQVRIPTRGALNYGRGQDIPEGWIGFFPAGAYYGPQVVEDTEAIVLQYGFGDDYSGGAGEAASSDDSEARQAMQAKLEQRMTLVKAMRERGEFREGVYIDPDPDTGDTRRRDASAAIHEEVTGTALVIPEPRYPAPILINPHTFEWREETPGVLVKRLGTFNETALGLSMARWAGGTHELGADRAQLVVSLSDGLVVDATPYPALTSVYSEMGEKAQLDGEPGAEAVVIDLPHRPDGLRITDDEAALAQAL